MRLKVILHMLGILLIFLGLFKFLPLGWAVYYREPEITIFLISLVLTVVTGLLLRGLGSYTENITIKESFAFVTLGWVLAALFGSLPFYLSGALPAFIDAFFEAMSGFTTTGATVIDDVEILGRGILFWRSLTQWLGGMGIIALFVAVLPRLGGGGFFIFRAEIPGPVKERIVPRIAETAKILWKIYVLISLIQVILLLFSGLDFFESLTHTLSTMATGGFSTRNASVASLNNPMAEVIITFFMFMAGINFSLYYLLYRGDIKTIWKDLEFRFYLGFLVTVGLLVSVGLYMFTYDSLLESIRYGFFQVVSITTTTGYATADFDQWQPFLRSLIFFLMFMGGCGGSTGGSIKQIRILVALMFGLREIKRMVHPRAVIPVRLGDRLVGEETVMNILGFLLIYILLFLLGSLLLTFQGMEIVSAFSAVAASLGNVGPGLDLVGPLQTYSGIPGAGKLTLSFLMLVGRLEIYTVLVLFLSLVPKSRGQ